MYRYKYFSPSLRLEDIRTHYIGLAKQYHPDRFSHLSDDKRREKEEIFQQITFEYDRLSKGIDHNDRDNKDDSMNDIDLEEVKREWQDIWTNLKKDHVFNAVKETFTQFQQIKDTFMQFRQFKDDVVYNDYKEEDVDEKVTVRKKVHYKVSLDDMHNGLIKDVWIVINLDDKVRVTLLVNGEEGDDKDEVEGQYRYHYRVNCSLTTHKLVYTIDFEGIHYIIKIKIKVIGKDHEHYRLDSLLGTNDLYYKEDKHICLYDYVQGTSFMIPYLHDTKLSVLVEPFFDQGPIILKGMGLQNKGDLYVRVVVDLPQNKDELISFIDSVNRS